LNYAANVGANGLILKGFATAGHQQFEAADATAIWVDRDSANVKLCTRPDSTVAPQNCRIVGGQKTCS